MRSWTLIAVVAASLCAPEGAAQVPPRKRDELSARVRKLIDEISRNVNGIEKIKNGPCVCGAPTHAACKTKDKCEPGELAQMAAMQQKALAARAELDGLKNALQGQAGAIKSRTGALKQEILSLEARRALFQSELVKGGKETIEEESLYKLRVGFDGTLTSLGELAGMAVEALELAKGIDEKTKAKVDTALSAIKAAQAAAAAFKKDAEDVERLESLVEAFRSARTALTAIAIAAGGEAAKKLGLMLDVTDKVYDLAAEAGATMLEIRKSGNSAELWRNRGPKLGEKTLALAGAFATEPNTKVLLYTFRTTYTLASGARVAWALGEEYLAGMNAYDMKVTKRAFLLGKVNHLGTEISFKKRELEKYEESGKK